MSAPNRSRRRTHLLGRRNTTACGLEVVDNLSTTLTPASVSCDGCRHSIQMADAEAKDALKRRRKERP